VLEWTDERAAGKPHHRHSGVDSAAYVPGWAAGIAAAATIPALVPALRRWLGAGLRRIAGDPGPRGALAATVGLLLLFAALATRAPSAVPLLGDGRLHLGDLERAAVSGAPFTDVEWANEHAPLGFRALHALHGFVRERGGGPADTFRWFGLMAAVAWVPLCAVTARAFADGVGRTTVFLLLVTGGSAQLLLGYAEIYAPLLPLTLAALLAAHHEAGRVRPPWLTGSLTGLAAAFHVALVTLLPLVLLAARGPARRVRVLANGATGLAVARVTMPLALLAAGLDPATLLPDGPGGNLLPLVAEPSFRHAYRLFSPAHLLDVANQILLVAPAVPLAAVLVRRSHLADARVRWLAAAGTAPLLLAFLASPEVGAFRDWDAFSFAALPWTLLAARVVARRPADEASGATAAIALAALAHTALWIGVNADAGRAESRFIDRLETSAHARAYGWETLGGHFLDTGRGPEAAEAFDRSAGASPHNPRLWVRAGQLRLRLGQLGESETRFRRALDADPEDAAALAGLGSSRAGRGEWEAAIEPLGRAVARDPDLAAAWFVLGLANREVGRTEAARAALGRYLQLRPDGPEADRVRAVLERLGQ